MQELVKMTGIISKLVPVPVKISEKRKWPLLVLTDLKFEDGTEFRDHTWVSYSNRFKTFQLNDRIEFDCRLDKYTDKNGVDKIGLGHIRNIKKI